MLDDSTRAQLAAYFERITQPVLLTAALDDSAASTEMRALLTDLAAITPKITIDFGGSHERRPSFQISRAGQDMGIRFAAVPMGHEFTSLVLALLQAGGHPPKIEPETVAAVQALQGDYRFETFMSLTCHSCPDVVQAINTMAVLNPRIRHVAIDGALFQSEVEARQVMAVPTVYLNGEFFDTGRMELAQILAKLDSGAAARDAQQLSQRAPYDVLIIGGGPAGAAAAVYAARKGIRTGVVAERIGGQTQDTLGIENYPSVAYTEGPKFAAALEAQMRAVGADLMAPQRVAALQPAAEPGGLAQVRLDNGGELKARAVVLATGARWRNINVPGEAEYKTRGVCFCPHCDGPLFKGKQVAVIGGGNSGVEAAIDLAGIVAHVTLLEFDNKLRADQVLVDRLKSLPNVAIHTSAQTTAITGDGQKVNGLDWTDRIGGASTHVELEGVFVQIGLVPNTEFLKGTLELSRHGEIITDARGATNLPGIFAAGDATTVPYKQIVVAAGEGARAALSAFDHLIRTPVAAG